ncbi:MAG: bifunctional 2-polyprenyl-6-hydroxyphenol methylase/3-demethylubiquinol 3-O-methyltransferase UbiG [Leptolyngbyaceae cyanobacterium]
MPRNNLAFYDQQAAQWWQETATIFPLSRLNPLRFQYFDRFVPDWQRLTVLDVGCGGGYTCEFLAQRGAIVTGLDQSAACIYAAKAHARQSGLTVDYTVGLSENLPFPDNTFDVVVCVDVLEHVQDVERAIAEISRVIKPQGWFCFDTINRTWQSRLLMIWLLEDLLRQIPPGVHDWHKFIAPSELECWLALSGFATPTIQGFDLFGRTPWANVARLLHYWRTQAFRVRFDGNTAVMYIGAAQLSSSNH